MWGQKDTTVHYTKTYRTTPSIDEAFFYDNVKGKSQKDGSINEISLLRKVHPALDKEALRAVRSINAKWTPSAMGNEKVNTALSILVNFMRQ